MSSFGTRALKYQSGSLAFMSTGTRLNPAATIASEKHSLVT
nr:MAG TPA: hypothetical protein [Caudoviricetes sp.]